MTTGKMVSSSPFLPKTEYLEEGLKCSKRDTARAKIQKALNRSPIPSRTLPLEVSGQPHIVDLINEQGSLVSGLDHDCWMVQGEGC